MPERAQQDCAPANLPGIGTVRIAGLLAAASIAVIVLAYFFAFRAVHEAQIREVPLVGSPGTELEFAL